MPTLVPHRSPPGQMLGLDDRTHSLKKPRLRFTEIVQLVGHLEHLWKVDSGPFLLERGTKRACDASLLCRMKCETVSASDR
jgi:hypothetical protein